MMPQDLLIAIPARMESSRLPKKMLLPLQGHSILYHTAQSAKNANIGDVMVATDHDAILMEAQKANVHAVMTPSHLKSGSDRIAHALASFDKKQHYQFIINLQGDIPFMPADALIKIAQLLKKDHAPMATLATKITHSPDINKSQIVKAAISFEDESCTWGRSLYFSRHPIPSSDGEFYHHIGVYGYRREVLTTFHQLPQIALEKQESLEQLRALHAPLAIFAGIIDAPPAAIDTQEDYEALL